jgi:hypothetical protein
LAAEKLIPFIKGDYIDPLNDRNKAPLHEVAKKGHFDIVRLLLENGVKSDARDKNGDTPNVLAEKSAEVLHANGVEDEAVFESCRSIKSLFRDAASAERTIKMAVMVPCGNDVEFGRRARKKMASSLWVTASRFWMLMMPPAVLAQGCEYDCIKRFSEALLERLSFCPAADETKGRKENLINIRVVDC